MSEPEKKMWFAPKTYGYGTGLPISWEGWAALALFFVGMASARLVSSYFFVGGERLASFLVFLAVLLVGFTLICHDRTEGGWRWRDGPDA